MGSTDWLLLACRMPSWATRRSSSWVAGRASRAVARKRSRPASHARTMASRWGGTPIDESQRTRVTTARAMWRAMPAWRRSSSSIRPCGSRGAALAALDLEASLAIAADYTRQPWHGHEVDLPVKNVLRSHPTARVLPVAPATLGGWLWRWDKEGLAVLFHELQHAAPGVIAGVLPLLIGTVKEAVRRPLVNVRLVRHPRRGQLPLEVFVLLGRRRLIRTGDEDQERCLHLRDVRLAAHRPAVKADDAVQAGVHRGLIPRVRPAEAEANREDGPGGPAFLGLQVGDGGGGVGRYALGRRGVHVRHVIEAIASIAPAGRPCEVVDGNAVDTRLGKSLRQVLEELVEAADVREDDHAGAGRLRRPREVGVELGPIGRGEDEVSVVGGRATDRMDVRQRRPGIVSVAHISIVA